MQKISREKLLEGLQAVRPGLSMSKVAEEGTYVTFTGSSMSTYNEKICVVYPFETEFQCSVSADKMHKILMNVPEGEMGILLRDGKLMLTGEKFQAEFMAFSESSPFVADIPRAGWKRIPSDFMEGLFLCSFSASKDMSAGELVGVRVEGTSIIASDDLRISRYTMRRGVKESFTVPASAVIEMREYAFVEYVLDPVWIYFRTRENAVFSVRRIEGEFAFDWGKYFEMDGEEVDLPQDLKKVVDTVSILTEDIFELDKVIDVKIDGMNIYCKGGGKQGCIQIETDVGEYFSGISFSINPIFFSQVLEICSSMVVGKDMIWLKSDKFEHVMALPLRGENR